MDKLFCHAYVFQTLIRSNYLLIYALQNVEGSWNGNRGKWSIRSSIQGSACSPSCVEESADTQVLWCYKVSRWRTRFCCRQGNVNIVNTPILDDLRSLFTSQTDRDALYFRKNIRYFNSHFFASFGASVDQRVATVAGDYLVPILMSCLCTLLFTIRILNLQRNSAYSKDIWGQCNWL